MLALWLLRLWLRCPVFRWHRPAGSSAGKKPVQRARPWRPGLEALEDRLPPGDLLGGTLGLAALLADGTLAAESADALSALGSSPPNTLNVIDSSLALPPGSPPGDPGTGAPTPGPGTNGDPGQPPSPVPQGPTAPLATYGIPEPGLQASVVENYFGGMSLGLGGKVTGSGRLRDGPGGPPRHPHGPRHRSRNHGRTRHNHHRRDRNKPQGPAAPGGGDSQQNLTIPPPSPVSDPPAPPASNGPSAHPVLSWLSSYTPPPETGGPDAWSGMLGSTSLQRLETAYTALAPDADVNQFIAGQKREFVFDADNHVLVNVRARSQDNLDRMQSDLQNNLGMTVTTVTKDQNMVTGFLPITAIAQLPAVRDYSAVTPVYAPIFSAGTVTTEGDQLLKADAFRAQYGYTGQGVTVGVISDSVNQVDAQGDSNPDAGIAESQRTGDLPAGGVTVLQDWTRDVRDEGRAMLEVIHDVAPGAGVAFHTGNGGPQNVAQGIRDLATQAGAQVIVDDVSYPNEPFFNDGVLTRAINDVYYHQNVAYVTAAGNNADHAWTSPFRPVVAQVADAPYTNFASLNPGGGLDQQLTIPGPGQVPQLMTSGQGQVLQHFSLQPGQTLDLAFQWDAAFLEGGSPQAVYQVPNEMDVLITDARGSRVLATFNDNTRNTDEALQRVIFTNDGSYAMNDFAMAFAWAGGPAPHQLKWVRFDSNAPAEGQGAPSIFGHAGASNALTVAATPASSPFQAEPYSSLGPVTRLFDYAGVPMARPQTFAKPDLTGPDAVQVANWIGTPGTAAQLPGTFPVFAGTSAAAAHVAAAVALQRNQHPGLFPLLIDQIITQTTQPLGPNRHDPRTGAGLVQLVDPAVTPTVGAVINASRELDNQSEVAVAIDPNNPNNIALSANENALIPGQGLYLSTDGGQTWTARVIADGNDGLKGSRGDPALAWDTFGNLYVAYVDNTNNDIDDINISTDGGQTFQLLAQIQGTSSSSVMDQESLAVGPDTGGNGQAIWLVASDVAATMPMTVAGAHITGPGVAGVSAFTQSVINFTPAFACNFSDITVGPNGEVAVHFIDISAITPDGPGTVEISVDPDGLGPAPFSIPVAAATINTAVFGPGVLPAMPSRTPGTETKGGVSWDRSNGPHRGRLYVIIEDSAATDDPATNVFVVSSDDNGATWSPRVQVNDDTSGNSHLFPRIAVDPSTGNVMAAWYDARNDLGQGGPGDLDGTPNTDLEIYAALSTDGGQTWAPNLQVSQNASSAILNGGNGSNDYGDYIGLAFNDGFAHIGWTDNSADTAATNPDGPNFDIATTTITVPSAGGVVLSDVFEPNETSDRAFNFHTLRLNVPTELQNLTIGNHRNGLPDYDWYRWTAGAAGTFTATYTIGSTTGNLEMHLWTLRGNTLVELAKTSSDKDGTLVVPLTATQTIFVEVKGANSALGVHDQGDYQLDVMLT